MRFKNILAYLIVTALSFLLLVMTYYYQKDKELKTQAINQVAKQSLHQLTYSEHEYMNVSSQFASVIELLSHSHTLYNYVQNPAQEQRHVVEEVWASVAVNQRWFTQIRFLDLNGNESIRINYHDNERQASAAAILQDKSQRDYFEYAKTLKENQIGTWGIDLEVEFGDFVLPYQPALRLITPVFIQGVKQGYLILNIDVWYLASLLNYSPDQRFSPEVIGEHGYYLAGNTPSKLFGNLLPARSQFNFSRLFPKAWEAIHQTKSGHLIENGHLITYNQISFSSNQKLFLINNFSQEELKELVAEKAQDLLQEASIVLLIALLLVLPATLLLIYYHKRSIEGKLARAALSGMSAVVISDRKHRAMLVNDQFCQLTGYQQQDVIMKNIIKLLLGEDHVEQIFCLFEKVASEQAWEGEISFNRYGSSVPVTVILRVQAVLSKSGKVSYYITSIVDISDRKELEEQLRVLSEKDTLTQLWNRRKFEIELKHHARLDQRYQDAQSTCLALLDIDHFKRINDQQGHDEGDRVIALVGSAIEGTLREVDFVARVGGEEFAIIMPHTTLQEAEMCLNRLRLTIELNRNISVTVSIGVTDLTANSTRSYKCADIALYEAKSSGRNRVAVCTSREDVA